MIDIGTMAGFFIFDDLLILPSSFLDNDEIIFNNIHEMLTPDGLVIPLTPKAPTKSYSVEQYSKNKNHINGLDGYLLTAEGLINTIVTVKDDYAGLGCCIGVGYNRAAFPSRFIENTPVTYLMQKSKTSKEFILKLEKHYGIPATRYKIYKITDLIKYVREEIKEPPFTQVKSKVKVITLK